VNDKLLSPWTGHKARNRVVVYSRRPPREYDDNGLFYKALVMDVTESNNGKFWTWNFGTKGSRTTFTTEELAMKRMDQWLLKRGYILVNSIERWERLMVLA